MTKRAGKKRFLKHQALISRLRVKRELQGLLDEDRRATAVNLSLLPSAPVTESSTLVNYPALIPIDTNKIHYRACSHPLHPNVPRRLNRPQVLSLPLPELLLPVALLPRSDPSKPITNSLPVLVKQISVIPSRPRIKARPADPLILQATQRKATHPVPIRPPPQTTSGLITQGLSLPQPSAISCPPAPLSTVIASITKPRAPRASLLIAAISQKPRRSRNPR